MTVTAHDERACTAMETSKLTACCLIPAGDAWPAIQELRLAHDREVHKWPPHMNLFYPFVPEDQMAEAAESLAQGMSMLRPLKVRFRKLGNFGGTVFLVPECEEDPDFQHLWEACRIAMPDVPLKHDAFKPHLTIGQFKNTTKASEFMAGCPGIDIATEISCVSLMARDTMKTPFRTPFRARLGGDLERGDDLPYECKVPWRWTFASCMPLCSADVAEGVGQLTRTMSNKLVRSLSRTMSGSAPPAPGAEACKEEVSAPPPPLEEEKRAQNDAPGARIW